METCNHCSESLTPLGFATILKKLGIQQRAKHSWSAEKGCVVSNGGNSYFALEKDTSLFTNEELFEIIKNYKEKSDRLQKLVEKPLTVGIFYDIFDYGDENSGVLMFKRFKNQFNSDIELFKNHLCSIDRAKWDKYFNNR